MKQRIELQLAHLADDQRLDRCLAEADVDLYLAGDRSPDISRRLADHLRHCEACRELLDFAGVAPPRRRPRALPWAVAATLTLGIGAGALSTQRQTAWTPKGGGDITRVAPARGDALVVAVARGDLHFRARAGDRLLTGDHLRLFYTATEPGFIAVYNVDDASVTTRLYPSGATAAPIAPGVETPLDGAVTVTPGGACEWLVAVVSEDPIAHADIESALRSPRRIDRARCQLEVALPAARSLVVIPFRH